MSTEEFLKRLHKKLEEAGWGDIDPEWFNPDNYSEDAKTIQGYIKEILTQIN